MEYSDEVLDHYADPRNVGGLDEHDTSVGASMLGNPEFGIVMRLHIKVDEGQVIRQAMFKAYGCGCTIATASLLTELLIGASLEEAKAISSQTIALKLKLPFVKMHCSVLAEDLLREAIKDYTEKQRRSAGIVFESA